MVRSPHDSVRGLTGPGSAFLHTGSLSFGLAESRIIERSFLAAGRRLREGLLHLGNDLAAGDIGLQGYLNRAHSLIRAVYFTTYSLGAISVFPFYTTTETDIGILDDELDSETGFLRRFGRAILRDRLDLSLVARTNLYVLALRGIFERGRLEAMPNGPYRWVLGNAEHCVECSYAAFNGPYQKNSRSGLGLPPIPGVPGDGRVCLGLTRCGCSYELESGVPVPNQDLAYGLRSLLLSEVVNGSSSVASGTGAE